MMIDPYFSPEPRWLSPCFAAQPPTPPTETPQIKGAMPNLGRPTERSDKTPPFDF